MFGLLLVGVLLDQQPGVVLPRSPEPLELQLVVAAPVYQPDGTTTVETVSASNAPQFIYGRRSLCNPATTSEKEPADAGYGWRVVSSTVSRTASELIVTVDWRRLWDGGKKLVNGPGGTVLLTLHPGDRIPLDHIPNTTSDQACRAVGMGLEVTVARSARPQPAVEVVTPLGAVEGGATPLNADIWLVHTKPSGNQEVLHQTVRIPASVPTGESTAFTFAAVKFTTPQGDVGVEIAGSFRRFRAPAAVEQVLLSMSRMITGGGAPATGLGGRSTQMIPLTSPTDVFSFEMPAPEGRGGGGGGRGGGVSGGTARGGGGGGGGGARGGGGTGGRVAAPPPSGAGARGAGGVMVGAGAGGRGGAGAGATAQTTSILDGHLFSLRIRLTPGT